jgi:HSP20 family protein
MALPVVRTSTGRRDPFRDLVDLHTEFDQLVQSVLAGPGGSVAGGRQAVRAWRPAAAISETETAYVVQLEVPGVKRQDVTIEVEDGRLAVTGEFKDTFAAEDGAKLHARTRRTGRFEYRARLPRGVDADAIGAELADGVLTITVTKPETAQPRRIEIAGA